MYCPKCGEIISLLGLLNRETKYKQFLCTNPECLTVYLQNDNGFIFPKDEPYGTISKEEFSV